MVAVVDKRGSFIAATTAHSYLAGFALALPIAYPAVPFYLLGFVVFASSFIYLDRRIDRFAFMVTLLAMLAAVASNLFGPGKYSIDPVRALFTALFFSFFLFGRLIPEPATVVRGYADAVTVLSVAVIGMAMIIQPWSAGLLMFSVPQSRLWGASYFPDWPNFFAFVLSLGFLLNALVYRRGFFAALSLAAALLTTSRTPLIAFAIYLIFEFFRNPNAWRKQLALASLFGIAVAIVIAIFTLLPSGFLDRLLITSDREDVYGYALQLFGESPWIGNGSVLLDESVGNQGQASYHNSYLDILVRHGLLGFSLFLMLIWPRRAVAGSGRNAYYAIILFFFVGSFFQNFFKHPHLMMMYGVIAATRGVLIQARHG